MIKSLSTEATLENAGLSPEERELFCNARPKAYEPYPIKAVEDFANWCRANSLWILAFGTGCGAIELRPLMTARFDANRFGVAGRPILHSRSPAIFRAALDAAGLEGEYLRLAVDSAGEALELARELGLELYKIDLAMVVVPRHYLLAVVDECLAVGVRGLVTITAGFAEGGREQGLELQQAMLDAARPRLVRIVRSSTRLWLKRR